MKEFDYSKWDNKPREMWVWDNDEENDRVKQFVVFIIDNRPLAVDKDKNVVWWNHCAEIEQTRRMTNYELAHWLWEGTQVGEFREYTTGWCCYTEYVYDKEICEEPVLDCIEIRVNGGEWKEPLIEE